MRAASRVAVVRLATVVFEVPYDLLGSVYGVLEQQGAREGVTEEFTGRGVRMRARVREAAWAEIVDVVRGATAGQVDGRREDDAS